MRHKYYCCFTGSRLAARAGCCAAVRQPNERTYLEENLGASKITLSEAELSSINDAAPQGVAAGERYPVHEFGGEFNHLECVRRIYLP